MAQEAVLKVKEAEDKGAELLKAATEKAKAVIDEARKQGIEKQKVIIEEANKTKEEMIEKAVKSANAECEPVIAKAEADIARILNPPAGTFEKVVNLVVERIVNLNGDS